jgi:sugar fermentation stimulation protein A
VEYSKTLQQGVLIKRYKRFLADIALPNGEVITIYCPNTGAMRSCSTPGAKVWFSDSESITRKYRYTWELYQGVDGNFVGVNTNVANKLVEEALMNHAIVELNGYLELHREITLPGARSRIDFMLESDEGKTYIEVKSVTYLEEGIGYFPDAVTKRGQRHIEELIGLKQQGHRAVLFFCVMHTGIHVVKPAFHIDPKYALLCQKAQKAGVEFIAYTSAMNENETKPVSPIEVRIE